MYLRWLHGFCYYCAELFSKVKKCATLLEKLIQRVGMTININAKLLVQ